jgi:hypothetical protein
VHFLCFRRKRKK